MDWPTASRRSRTTRREQNLALLGAVASGAVIAVGLVLLLLSRANPQQGARLRGTASDLVAPVWSVVRVPFDWIGDGFGHAGDYLGAASRNRQLEAQVRAQDKALQTLSAMQRENAQLKALLGVVQPQTTPVAVARIAGASSGGVVRSALVSAGRAQGVASGLPVRVEAGLVGRTIEAGNGSARVLLLTDTNSRVPVTIVRTGQAALAIGANGALLDVRDRVGAEVPLVAGDQLVTSGDGGVFAPGIPVAVIVDAKSEPPRARPYVNPAGLGLVLIESAYLPVPVSADTGAPGVPVPREAGGARPKPAIVSNTPRAVASAPSIADAPVVAAPAPVVAAPPPLRFVPGAMKLQLPAPVLSASDVAGRKPASTDTPVRSDPPQ